MGDKINILFICKYNRFRSRIAETYFNKINKNPNIKTKSAGLFKGNPVDPKTIKLAKEKNLDISGKTKGISSKLLAWQDIIVVMADDVPQEIFKDNIKYGKKVVVFKIKDAKSDKKTEVKELVKIIMSKIDLFNKRLNSGKIK